MRIEITGKNFTVDEAFEKLVNKKFSKLNRYFDDEVLCRIVCKTQNYRQTMEATITFNKGTISTVLRCEETSDNMLANIDNVAQKLERQTRKHRTKLDKQFRGGSSAIVEGDVLPDEDKEANSKIVRRKVRELNVMSEDEAIEQLELIGNSFYLFINAKTNKVNVIYIRQDKNYGIIETEY